jgi:tetratricopeptide (TPR) repeat protein
MIEPGAPVGSEGGSSDRLESWKAIATYLGRDVSTVRRWERTEGLPVHRHHHAARGSAYAYKSELDRWFESRRATLDVQARVDDRPASEDSRVDDERDESARAGSVVTPIDVQQKRRRVAWIAAAVTLAAVAGTMYARTRLSAPTTAFQPRNWILIGDIENRTGDRRLDDTIQFALERDLSESQFVNVVSRERVADTLRLMKRPPDMRIDRATGVEVCLRDGGIQAMLTGRVEKFGGTYRISTLIVDPNDSGRTIGAADVSAADDARIFDAARELSGRIRRALGEDLQSVQRAPVRLERVTTGSLEALQFYTQGTRAVLQREWRVGAEVLQLAVEKDPNFAAARIYLAYCMMNLGRPTEDYLPQAREAARLAEHQPDREQYFILASYQSMLGERDNAIGLYETLLKLYPDHYWGLNNLFQLYNNVERRSAQWPLMQRVVNARPNDFLTTMLAVRSALVAGVDIRQVDLLATRARQLKPDNPSSFPEKAESEFLDFLPAFDAWLGNDAMATVRLAETIGATSRRHAKIAAMLELGLGRIAAAEELVLQEETPTIPCAGCGSDREGDLALLAFFRRDRSALASHLAAAQQNYGRQLPLVVWLSSQAQPPEEFVQFFRAWSSRPDDGHSAGANGVWANAVRAEVRSRRGDTTAVADLERAVRGDDQTRPRSLRDAESLAEALERQGDLSGSAAVLEDATRVKTRVFSALGGESFGGVFWLRLRSKLARVYRDMGRIAEADRVDSEVAKMLILADHDFKLFP